MRTASLTLFDAHTVPRKLVRPVRAVRGTMCCSPDDAASPAPGAGTATSRSRRRVSAASSLRMTAGLTVQPYISRPVSPVRDLRAASDASGCVVSATSFKAGQQLTRRVVSAEPKGPRARSPHPPNTCSCGSCRPVGNTCAHAALSISQCSICSSCKLLLAVRAEYGASCCGQSPLMLSSVNSLRAEHRVSSCSSCDAPNALSCCA
jgi:hypothetical protein